MKREFTLEGNTFIIRDWECGQDKYLAELIIDDSNTYPIGTAETIKEAKSLCSICIH